MSSQRPPTAPGNFNALTGTATFRGGAVGKYATVGQVGQQNARIGTFTAATTFTADFGTAMPSPAPLQAALPTSAKAAAPLQGGEVTLGSAANIGLPSDIVGAATASGNTVGSIGGVPVTGTWGADFYGSDNVTFTTDADRIKYPVTHVSGGRPGRCDRPVQCHERYRRPCGRLWRGLQHWQYVREIGQPPHGPPSGGLFTSRIRENACQQPPALGFIQNPPAQEAPHARLLALLAGTPRGRLRHHPSPISETRS